MGSDPTRRHGGPSQTPPSGAPRRLAARPTFVSWRTSASANLPVPHHASGRLASGDRSENGDYIYGKRRLREIDRRIRFLSTRLASAEVVDPKQQKKLDEVFFGATVTYADGRGKLNHHDRRDRQGPSQSRSGELGIAVARALMKAHEGDIVDVHAPSGVEQIEVLEIRYGGAHGETE